ncbi:hypothetical protein NEHOM01_2172 [Nematocida homosporus]|uniref:uncharacterized protein n=1 Tax=Nematocida homosporus TaxID=1912981 RepID=UPI00221E5AA5|nr:uncharacterized protein NEHOM01_2172 [Nematocida homosporus]KAI5187430.1 hypothetical protein NEHOM01_2172 [Nematocida homosporus]
MSYTNRNIIDIFGISLTSVLLIYLGVLSPGLFLWEDIKESMFFRGLTVVANCLVALVAGLFLIVSNTRGYVKSEEYVLGGKYCYECRHAKAERVHHCSRCKRCINRMDHHCAWIGACVNGRNLGNFTKLIFVTLVTGVVHLALYGYAAQRRLRIHQGKIAPRFSSVMICINILVIAALMVLLGLLAIRHIRIIKYNTTYLEMLQARRLKRLGMYVPENPYNKGGKENFKEIFGTTLDFILCRTPKSIDQMSYKNYWPPLRVTKSTSTAQIPSHATQL